MKELIKREIPFIDQPNNQANDNLAKLIADIAAGVKRAENHIRCDGSG